MVGVSIVALLTGSLPATAQLPIVESREALPNGGLEGEPGVENHYRLWYDGAEPWTQEYRSGHQSVNLARHDAEPVPWHVLGNLAVYPHRGTLFRQVVSYSFFFMVPEAPSRNVGLQMYMSLDWNGDRVRDECLIRGVNATLSQLEAWSQVVIDRASTFTRGGPDCGPQQEVFALGLLEADPTFRNAEVLGISLQTVTGILEPWPAGEPVLVDDVSLLVDGVLVTGPENYHAQFAFQPPLISEAGGLERFDLGQGDVLVGVTLHDGAGQAKSFAAGSTASRARLVLTGDDQSAPLQFTEFRFDGALNASAQNSADFRLPVEALLFLQQAMTTWTLRIESPNELFAQGAPVFPSAFAFYNAGSNAAFSVDAGLADRLDIAPSFVRAVLEPRVLDVTSQPDAVKSGDEFAVQVTVRDAADRPISTQSHSVILGLTEGPGPVEGLGAQATQAGVASFDALRILAAGRYRLNATLEGSALRADLAPIMVSPGDLAFLRVADTSGSPVGNLSLTTDDQRVLQALGFDAAGNLIGQVASSWQATGGIGTLAPGGAVAQVVFDPARVGSGRVRAQVGNVSSETGLVSVSVGRLHALKILNGPIVQTAGSLGAVTYRAAGVDADSNPIAVDSLTGVRWAVEAAGGSFDRNVFTPSGSAGVYHVQAAPVSGDAQAAQETFTLRTGNVYDMALEPARVEQSVDAASPILYRVVAHDQRGHEVPIDEVDDVSWSVLPSSGGNFTENRLLPGRIAGNYTVQGQLKDDATVMSSAVLILRPSASKSLRILGGDRTQSLSNAAPIAFEAEGRDAHGNAVPLNASRDVRWSILPAAAGAFAQNVLTPSGQLGTHTVQAVLSTDSSVGASVAFTVTERRIARLVMEPAQAVQRIGELAPITFQVRATDAQGRALDVDVAEAIAWSVDDAAGGSFTRNVFTPGERAGTYVLSAALKGDEAVRAEGRFVLQAGSAAALRILNGDIAQVQGAVQPVDLDVQVVDARDNVVDASPQVSWSVSGENGGRFDGDRFIPEDRLGERRIAGVLDSDSAIQGSIRFMVIAAGPPPEKVRAGDTFYFVFELPADATKARADIVDRGSGQVVVSVELERAVLADGSMRWVGQASLSDKGDYAVRLSYVNAAGEEIHAAETDLDVTKSNTPSIGVGLAIALAVLGTALYRRRR